MSNAPVVTLSLIGVTPTRPAMLNVSEPLNPGVAEYSTLPLALAAPCTSDGAATATGRTAIGARTSWLPSLHVSEPIAHAPSVAVVRSKRTVKVACSPGARLTVEGVTETSKPGRVAVAVYVAADEPTFLTRRVTVWTPASVPIAIEAWFSSEPEIGASVSNGGAKCTPRPTRYC